MVCAPATPPIRFRTLGATDLRNPDGDEVLGVLTQPKRLALLAYLAIATPIGFHRRDTLLALFWPELDLTHARDALNQAIRHLRIELGAEVVVSRGPSDIGLDENRFWCDARAFRQAIIADRSEEAVDLYQGDLLEGLFASGAAPEFEQWLESERRDLRRRAASAALNSAERAAARGDVARASACARGAAALRPESEDELRRVVAVLDAVGERSTALALFDEFALRVAQEFGAEPTPETRSFIEGIRTRRDLRTSTPNENGASTAALIDEPKRAPSSQPAAAVRRRGGGKSPLLGGAVLAALPLAVLLILRSSSTSNPSAVAARDSNLVAVAPFDVLSKEHELWREGLVDLLSSELEGAGPLHTVSPSTVMRGWGGRADQASATALGRATGAGLVLYGNVVATGGDSVRVSARLLHAPSGTSIEFEVRDLGSRLDRAADSVSVRVLRELGRTRPIAAVPSAGFGSTSLPALKAYLAGEKFYRLVNRDSAMVYYKKAVSMDSTFALAWWKMARVRSMGVSEADDTVSIYGLRAGALNHGLSPRDSLLVLAESLYAVGQDMWGADKVPRLHATLEEATRRFPDDAEAWFQVARARVYAPLVGNTPERTLEAIDRSIRLDSAFAPAVDWLSAVKIALRLDDVSAARRYLLLGTAWEPPQRTEGLRFAAAMLADPRAGRRVLNRWVDTASDPAMHAAADALEDWPDAAESAVRLRRVLLARAVDSPDTSLVEDRLVGLYYALARRGHLREAYSIYQGRPAPFFTQTALFGGIPAKDVAARATRQPQGPIAWFAQRRDTVALKLALRQLDSIARRNPQHGGSPTPAWDVARGHAYLALARSDTAEAIRRFIPVIDSLCPGCSFSRTYVDVYSAAPLLSSRGMDQKAERWLNFENTTVLRPVFDVWFALARARIAERLGKREKAAAAYRFVADSWERGDPQLQVHVSEARTALKRLGAQATQ